MFVKKDYIDLYHDWIKNSKWWFHADDNDDNEICNKYSYLVNDVSWRNVPFNENNLQYWIGVIIFNDQIIRHINRVSEEKYQLHNVIDISYMILNDYVPHSQHLTSNDLIFVLLPLRHTCIPEHVFYATQCAFKYLENKPYSETIKKFIKAAFKRVIHENNHILIKKSELI